MCELSPSTLAGLVKTLGTPEFPRRLLAALNAVAGVSHIAIIAFDNQLAGHVVAAESLGRRQIAKAAGRIYESSLLYRHDPNVDIITSQAKRPHQPLLCRLRVQDIRNASYRSQLYERFDLIERLSITEYFAGQWNTLNVYRNSAAGPFGKDDFVRMEAVAELVIAFIAKHFGLMSPPWRPDKRRPVEQLEKIVRGLDPALTARQVQVCARALDGMTNGAIALDLGIQTPTVATLRKRAYAVLNISSLNELFALCLARSISFGTEQPPAA